MNTKQLNKLCVLPSLPGISALNIVSGCGEQSSLAVRKGRDRSLLRSRVFSYRNSRFKEPAQPDTNNLICSSCSSCASWFKKTHFSSSRWPKVVKIRAYSCLFVVPVVKLKNKNMKNKANFNSINFTATSCSTATYNDLSPKTQNGTNPNEANLKPIPNTLKPSDISDKPANPQKLFFAKRTQFERPKSVASNCCRKVYDALQTKRNEPKRTQLKPIKANLRHLFHGESRHKDSGCPAAKKRLR